MPGIEIGADVTSFAFFEDYFGDRYAMLSRCSLALPGRSTARMLPVPYYMYLTTCTLTTCALTTCTLPHVPLLHVPLPHVPLLHVPLLRVLVSSRPNTEPCAIEMHSVTNASLLGSTADCSQSSVCDQWVMRTREPVPSPDMPDWAAKIKDKAEAAKTLAKKVGGAGALLAGLGPPWALDLIRAVLERDGLAAFEALLAALGDKIPSFAPGSSGASAYAASKLLSAGDVPGALSVVVDLIVDRRDLRRLAARW